MAFPTGWLRKQKITVDNTKVSGSGSHTDLPVLITLDHLDVEIVDAGSNSALNGGGDVRFSSDAAGTTQLAIDVVSFITNATEASRVCEIWVKVPSLSTSADTDIYIWYKKVGEVQPAVGAAFGRNAVWPDSAAVLHFNEDIVDSSGNTTPTSSATDLTYVDGTYGRAAKFTTSLITVPITDPTTNATLIMRMRQPSGTKTNNGGFKFGGESGVNNLNHITFTDNKIYNDFGHNTRQTSIALVEDQTIMTQLAIRVSIAAASDVFQILYNNLSKLITTGPTALDFSAAATTSSDPARTIGTTGWQVEIENFRIDKVLRSVDWIATEHANQNDPATFATAGTPEEVGGATTRRYSLSLTGVG